MVCELEYMNMCPPPPIVEFATELQVGQGISGLLLKLTRIVYVLEYPMHV